MSVVEAERLSRLEGKGEEISKRMNDFKSVIDSLWNVVITTRNEMKSEINNLRNEMKGENQYSKEWNK